MSCIVTLPTLTRPWTTINFEVAGDYRRDIMHCLRPPCVAIGCFSLRCIYCTEVSQITIEWNDFEKAQSKILTLMCTIEVTESVVLPAYTYSNLVNIQKIQKHICINIETFLWRPTN